MTLRNEAHCGRSWIIRSASCFHRVGWSEYFCGSYMQQFQRIRLIRDRKETAGFDYAERCTVHSATFRWCVAAVGLLTRLLC